MFNEIFGIATPNPEILKIFSDLKISDLEEYLRKDKKDKVDWSENDQQLSEDFIKEFQDKVKKII